MTRRIMVLVGLALVTLMLSACDQLGVGGDKKVDVVVIDLEAVATAIGEDEAIEQKMEEASVELARQLNEMAADLEAQLEEERAKLNDSSSLDVLQTFEQRQAEARQKFSQAQAQAQQEAQRYRAGLINEFHVKIQPATATVAAQHGATITLLANPSNFWFDASVEITDEVIELLLTELPAEVEEEVPAE